MRHSPRFSIRSIMATVLFAAVGLSALRHASDLTASLVVSATLLALGVATLGAAFLRGRRRAYWAGFAAFGWGYAALSSGPWAAEAIGPRLATTKLLEYAGPHIDLAPDDSQPLYLYTTLATASTTSPPQILADVPVTTRLFTTPPGAMVVGAASEPFLRVGHGLFTLILALLGGAVARRFHDAATPTPAPGGIE
jgi:hypothetical protein